MAEKSFSSACFKSMGCKDKQQTLIIKHQPENT
jgi:hypothetical protein